MKCSFRTCQSLASFLLLPEFEFEVNAKVRPLGGDGLPKGRVETKDRVVMTRKEQHLGNRLNTVSDDGKKVGGYCVN